MTNVWIANADRLFPAYTKSASSLRFQLVTRALLTGLCPAPGRVLDVGGGFGLQAIMLAREGYEVTVLDPDVSMLAEVERRLADEPGRVRRRVEMVTGIGERIAETVGGDFDGVCCHSVLMYIEDPQPLIDAMVSATRPSGLVSILTVNPRAAAMRAGLQQRWDDAIASLRTARNRDSQVVTTYDHGIAAVTDKLGSAGAQVTSWHGVGVFTDHLPKQNLADVAERPLDPNLLEAEWLAGMVDPYRQVARSVHLMARRRPENARSWLRG